MSIGRKFLFLILLSLIGVLTVGGLGVFEMRRMDGEVVTINEQVMPSIQLAQKLEKDFDSLRVALLYHILNTEAAQMAALEKEMAGLQGELQKTVKGFEPYLSDERDRKLHGQIAGLLQEYFFMVEQIVVLSRGNMDDVARGQAEDNRLMIQQLTKAIGELVQYKTQQAKEAGESAHAAYKQGVILMLGVVLFALVSTSGVGAWLYQGVAASLREMLTTFNRVETALDFTVRNVREALDVLRGTKSNPILLSRAIATAKSTLTELAREEPQGPGVLAGDDASPAFRNITAAIEGDVLRVQYECSPVIPNNYILVTVYARPYTGSATA